MTAAIALAMEGQRVLVLERGDWPRDKVCGEGLMPSGVDCLERLGVLKYIPEDMQRPFRGIAWFDDSGVKAEGDFAEGHGLGVRRLGLSEALRTRAAELEGITLLSGARVMDVAPEPDCVRLEVEWDGLVRTLRVRLLVGADGLRSLVRRALELEGPAPVKQRRWGARQHFRVAPWSDQVEVYWSEGVEAYVTPSSDGRVEIAFLWDEARFELPLKGQRMMEGLLGCFPVLQQRLVGAEVDSKAASTGPLARAALRPVDNRVVLIGDAYQYLDGITGEGISVSVLAAEAIAPDLARCVEAKTLSAQALAPVGQQLEEIYRESFHMTHWALTLTRSKWLRRLAIHGMSRSPQLFTHILEVNMARAKLFRMPLNGLIRFGMGMIAPRGAPLLGVLPWLLLFGLAFIMRSWMQWALDLRDLPGPAAAVTVVRAWMEPVQIQWDVRIVSTLQTILGDIERAAWLASFLGSMAQVMGAALLGWGMLGRRGGLAAGTVAALWSLSIHDALIVGSNPIATGLAWLGVGLCVAGTCGGRKGWLWMVLGATLAVLGTDIKVVVLPVLPLLGAVFFARSPSRKGRWTAAAWMIMTAWICWEWLQPESSQPLVGSPRLDESMIASGWAGILDMAGRGHPEGHLEVLMAAACVGGLIPGPRWFPRVALLSLSMGVVLVTSAILGPVVKPRYLLPPSLGLVVLSGLAMVLLAHWLERVRPHARHWVWLFPFWLFLDGIAFMEGLGQRRMNYAGAEGPALPLLPSMFSARYVDMPDPMLLGLTGRGMVNFRQLIAERPGGVATPMLRDNRHTQAEMLSYLEDHPYRILDAQNCCQDRDRSRCARELVQDLDRAGMAMVLPIQTLHERRVKSDDDVWLEELYRAARQTHPDADEETRWWWIREARGSGGPLPCIEGPTVIGGDPQRRPGDREG